MTTDDWATRVTQQNTLARRLGNPSYTTADERRFLTAVAVALRDAEKRIGDKSPAARGFCSVAAGQIEAAVEASLAPDGSLPAKLRAKYHADKCADAASALMARIEALTTGDGLQAKKLEKLREDMTQAIVAAGPKRVEMDYHLNFEWEFIIKVLEDAKDALEGIVDEARVDHRIKQIKDAMSSGYYLDKEGKPSTYGIGMTGDAINWLLRDIGVVTPSNFDTLVIDRDAWPYFWTRKEAVPHVDAFVAQWHAEANAVSEKVYVVTYCGGVDGPFDDHDAYIEALYDAEMAQQARHRTPDAVEPVKRHLTPAARKKLLARLSAMSETDVMRMVEAGEITNEEAHGQCAGAGWRTHRGDDGQLGDARNWGARFKIRRGSTWFFGDPLPPPVSSYPSAGVLPYGKWIMADGVEYLYDRSYCPLWRRDAKGVVTQAKNEWVHYTSEVAIYDDCCPPRNNRATVERCVQALADWGLPTTPDAMPAFNAHEEVADGLQESAEQPELRV